MTTLNELAKAAIDSLNDSPLSDGSVILEMSGKWGASKRRYLAGPKSPQGDVIQEKPGSVMVLFSALDLLAWCVANGVDVQIVKVEEGL